MNLAAGFNHAMKKISRVYEVLKYALFGFPIIIAIICLCFALLNPVINFTYSSFEETNNEFFIVARSK